MDIQGIVIMFLKCNCNNRAVTVLELFLEAVLGLSSRERGDKGVKSVDVAWHMLSHPSRGPDRGSFIVGRSCHNQRIEKDDPQQFDIDWNMGQRQILSTWDGDNFHLDDSAEISIPEIDPPLANAVNNFLNQFNPLADNQYCGLQR